jgi:hypothetical protein
VLPGTLCCDFWLVLGGHFNGFQAVIAYHLSQPDFDCKPLKLMSDTRRIGQVYNQFIRPAVI